MAIGKTIGRLSIRVIPDASKFRDDIRTLLTRVEQTMTANLTVRADTTEALAEVTRLRTEAERNAINMRLALNEGAARAQLAALARPRTVVISAKVDQNALSKVIASSKGIVAGLSGWLLVRQTIDEFKGRLLALPTAIPSIAKVALAIGNLGGIGLAGLAGTGTVLADLGKILTGFLPAAPGLLLGLGIGITTLILAAKDGGKYLGDLKPEFQALQDIVSNTFWAKAAAPIHNMITSLLPQLRTGFRDVSQALGDQAAAVAGAVQKALSGGVLQGWFSKVAESMRIITPFVGDFVRAFVTLGTVGLGFMPDFARWVGQIGRDFNTWVQAAAMSGKFTGFVAGAVSALRGLFGVASGLVRIISALDSAARNAGGSGLNGMAILLGKIATALESGPVQAGLATLFVGATAGVSSLADGIASLLGSLGGMAPELATVLDLAGKTLGTFATDIGIALNQPAVKKGLVDLFVGLRTGLGVVGQVLPAVGVVIGHLLTTLGTAMTTFGPLLAAVKETFAPKLVILADAANNLIPILGGALTLAVKALEPVLWAVFGVISNNMGVFQTLVVVIGVAALAFKAATLGIALYKGALVLAKAVQAGFILGQYGLVGATYAVGTAQKVGAATALLLKGAQSLVTGALFTQIGALASNAAAWTAMKVRAIASWVAIQASVLASSARLYAIVIADLARQGAAWVALKVQAIGAWAVVQAQALAASARVAVGVIADLARQGVAWVAAKATMLASVAAFVAVRGAQLAAAAATGVATAAQWLLNAALTANPIGVVVVAIAALVGALVWFFTQTEVGKTAWQEFTRFLGEAWTNIVGVVQTAAKAVVDFLAKWGPLILAAIAPVIGVPLLIAQHWDEIVAVVQKVWADATKVLSAAFDNISRLLSTWLGYVVTVLTTAWNIAVAVVRAAISLVAAVITATLSALRGTWDAVWSGIQQVVAAVWGAISQIVGTAINTVAGVIRTVALGIAQTWAVIWGGIQSAIAVVWAGIRAVIEVGIGLVRGIIATVMRAIDEGWFTSWSGIRRFIDTIWGQISAAIATAIGIVRSTIASVLGIIRGTWDAAWAAIRATVDRVWDLIAAGIRDAIGTVRDLIGRIGDIIGGVRDRITDAFRNAGSWLVGAGRSIVEGLISGIRAMIGQAAGAASDLMGAVARFFPHSPAPEGPFSGRGWTPYSGQAIGLGLADGIDSTVTRVRRSALALMSAASAGSATVGVAGSISPSDALLSGSGGGVTINGNVGWQPAELLREAELRQRQQAMAHGIDGLAAFA